MANIAINKAFLVGLKEAYEIAVKNKRESFSHKGHEFVTSFAKYFLEYYCPQFNVKFP
jgi:hypothetical protein